MLFLCALPWTSGALAKPAGLSPEKSSRNHTANTAPAKRASQGAVLVKRKILALYDGSRIKETANTRIHKQAEMPLNHMGYEVRYWDINKHFPKPEDLVGYRGNPDLVRGASQA